MRGRKRQAKVIGAEDRRGGDQLRPGALRVGEVRLADLGERDGDTLPAGHGAETERDGDRHLRAIVLTEPVRVARNGTKVIQCVPVKRAGGQS